MLLKFKHREKPPVFYGRTPNLSRDDKIWSIPGCKPQAKQSSNTVFMFPSGMSLAGRDPESVVCYEVQHQPAIAKNLMTATSLKSPQFFSTFASNAKVHSRPESITTQNVNYNTGSATTFLDRPKFSTSTRTSKFRITDISSLPSSGYRKAYYSKNLVNTNNKPPSPTVLHQRGQSGSFGQETLTRPVLAILPTSRTCQTNINTMNMYRQ